MKRNMFIAAILLIWNSGIGQQKTKTAITYQVDIAVIIDTAKVAQNARGHRQYGVIRKNVISILKDTKPQFFTLLIADNEAMFYKTAELGNDNDQQINLTKILTDNRNFYQNRLTNESLEHITTLGNDFIVTHNPVDWTITSESK